MNLNRTIQLYDLINSETVSQVIPEIIRLNIEDRSEPIHLLIDSGGGYMLDSFALLSAMKSSKAPIYTYTYGYCMSAAVPPYLAGEKRYAGEFATFMLHQPKEPLGEDKYFVMENRLEETKRLMNNRIKYITSRCRVTELDFEMHKYIDWFMDVNEAIEYGIVDAII
jgi:ATP-dependent protease ClpP protease subunit